MIFRRPHHQRIARILESLDASLFANNYCYFGGGTALALLGNEYRESVDIDFLVSDIQGYRELRSRVVTGDGFQSLLKSGAELQSFDAIRADQYGIRTRASIDGMPVKLEIVLEGRIAFSQPDCSHKICGVSALTYIDLAASKMLANSDRWADAAVNYRDVIDLAMMRIGRPGIEAAFSKAEAAYGPAIQRDLLKAIEFLVSRKETLQCSMDAMEMNIPRAQLVHNFRELKRWVVSK